MYFPITNMIVLVNVLKIFPSVKKTSKLVKIPKTALKALSKIGLHAITNKQCKVHNILYI